MAEIVGLVSAITGLIGVGCKIARSASDLADELGTAGQQLQSLAVETKALTWILQTLKTRLSLPAGSRAVAREAILIAQNIVDLCDTDIQGIKQCLVPFDDLGNDSKRILFKRAPWIFAKSKMTTRQASLGSLKLSLTLFLHTLELSTGVGDDTMLHEEVEHILARPTNVKMDIFRAEQADLLMEEQLLSTDGCSAVPILAAAQPGQDTVTPPKVQLDAAAHSSIGLVIASSTTGHDRTAVDHGPRLHERNNTPALSTIQTMTDDHFLWIAEHVRLQQFVTRYAVATLKNHTREEDPIAAIEQAIPQKNQARAKTEQHDKADTPNDPDTGESSSSTTTTIARDKTHSRNHGRSISVEARRPPLQAYVESEAGYTDDQPPSIAIEVGHRHRARRRPEARRTKYSAPELGEHARYAPGSYHHHQQPWSAFPTLPDQEVQYHAGYHASTHRPYYTEYSHNYGAPPQAQYLASPFFPARAAAAAPYVGYHAPGGNEWGYASQYHPSWQAYSPGGPAAAQPSPPPRRARMPVTVEMPAAPDPEKEAMKARLAAIEAERDKVEAAAKVAEVEAKKMKKEAEDEIQSRLREMQRERDARDARREAALEAARLATEELIGDAAGLGARKALGGMRRADLQQNVLDNDDDLKAGMEARQKIEAGNEAGKHAWRKRGIRRIFSTK